MNKSATFIAIGRVPAASENDGVINAKQRLHKDFLRRLFERALKSESDGIVQAVFDDVTDDDYRLWDIRLITRTDKSNCLPR